MAKMTNMVWGGSGPHTVSPQIFTKGTSLANVNACANFQLDQNTNVDLATDKKGYTQKPQS